MHEVRVGTRGSALALAQARQFLRRLKKKNPGTRFQLVTVRTFGDEYQGVEIFRRKNVGVFTKAIESRLLSGELDIAVHSLKDLPTELPRRLTLGAIPKRGTVRDVLLSRRRWTLGQLPSGARVGTGSPRRKSQLLRLRPDLRVTDLRGNLDTRVAKVLKQKVLDAVVVAEAGLVRIKKFLRYARPLPAALFLPAVGQGALGTEIRRSDRRVLKMLRRVHDADADKTATVERLFLKALRGGCRVPVGAYCRIRRGKLTLKGSVYSVRDGASVQGEISVPLARYRSAGGRLARLLLAQGAGKFLRLARKGV